MFMPIPNCGTTHMIVSKIFIKFKPKLLNPNQTVHFGPLTLSVPGGVLQDPPYSKSDAIFLWMRKFFPILDEFLS